MAAGAGESDDRCPGEIHGHTGQREGRQPRVSVLPLLPDATHLLPVLGSGDIDASAFKGGWLRANTATRQMGLVDGYAVAIITDQGPVEVQSDGDAAHVDQIDRVARVLRDRLQFDRDLRKRC